MAQVFVFAVTSSDSWHGAVHVLNARHKCLLHGALFILARLGGLASGLAGVVVLKLANNNLTKNAGAYRVDRLCCVLFAGLGKGVGRA